MFENLAIIYFSALAAIFITLVYIIKKNIEENKNKRLKKSKQIG